jgi:uncharacterized membrane protein YkoI
MKTLKALIMTAILSISGLALAHQNHDEIKNMEISKSEAIMIAMNEVSDKVESNELDGSWNTVDSKFAVLERMNGRQVWKVTLGKKDDDSSKALNVYVSKLGDFISISK